MGHSCIATQSPSRGEDFKTGGLNPDSAVEREIMIKEQTFRSEDNVFCL
jgi:hypothetical protein